MKRPEFSAHARDMVTERKILEDWVWRTINSPDREEIGPDKNIQYLKAIEERQGRVLRVIINRRVEPNRVVTVFFDRRLGRKK